MVSNCMDKLWLNVLADLGICVLKMTHKQRYKETLLDIAEVIPRA